MKIICVVMLAGMAWGQHNSGWNKAFEEPGQVHFQEGTVAEALCTWNGRELSFGKDFPPDKLPDCIAAVLPYLPHRAPMRLPLVEPLSPLKSKYAKGFYPMTEREFQNRMALRNKDGEPMIVPAIQKTRLECVIPSEKVCYEERTSVNDCPCGYRDARPYYTCENQSRVLLTSEDGVYHWCLKFSNSN